MAVRRHRIPAFGRWMRRSHSLNHLLFLLSPQAYLGLMSLIILSLPICCDPALYFPFQIGSRRHTAHFAATNLPW